jgi:hypothetical protein
MTQFQFELICKIIENGAPALAQELCSALDSFVQAFNALRAENEELKKQATETPETAE